MISQRFWRGVGSLAATAFILWLMWCVCKALNTPYAEGVILYALYRGFCGGWNMPCTDQEAA